METIWKVAESLYGAKKTAAEENSEVAMMESSCKILSAEIDVVLRNLQQYKDAVKSVVDASELVVNDFAQISGAGTMSQTSKSFTERVLVASMTFKSAVNRKFVNNLGVRKAAKAKLRICGIAFHYGVDPVCRL